MAGLPSRAEVKAAECRERRCENLGDLLHGTTNDKTLSKHGGTLMDPHRLSQAQEFDEHFFTEVFALCCRPIAQAFPGALLGRGKRINVRIPHRRDESLLSFFEFAPELT